MKTKPTYIAVDGNTAVSNIAYQTSDMAIIYPITPSSPMAEHIDELRASGTKNAFGNVVEVTEMQSEAGAAGALHGALTKGSLATTFTSSQGLLLMIPNMYKIAGEGLPCVIHVAARTVATHALSIFGDHSDVMAARATGFALLCSSSVQEAQDMALAAHLTTLESHVPFLHFFDGFRTSHEINKIQSISNETIKSLIDFNSVAAFRQTGLTSDAPTQRGTAQNPDVYFQNREASNPAYQNLPSQLQQTFNAIAKATGRKYKLFDYVGAPDATDIIVSMGSSTQTIQETITYLNSKGHKYGLVKVRLFRPFSIKHFVAALPKTVQTITILDRTKESGAVGEPLYTEVVAALAESGIAVKTLGGRYGLSSKDFTPQMCAAVFKNAQSKNSKNHFTVGINDDVTHTSLKLSSLPSTLPKGTKECKFFGLGSDGTVSANKSSVKIIAQNTPLYAQAYFEYDSKKAGSITVSHLRFGKQPIMATYLTQHADLIAIHNPTYIKKFDCLESLKKNGTVLLNASWTNQQLQTEFPAKFKQQLAQNNANLYIIDAEKIASAAGMPGKINVVMQTCFFKLVDLLPEKKAIALIKDYATKTYGKKGPKVVEMNINAIDNALAGLRKVQIPSNWKTQTLGSTTHTPTTNQFVEEILLPISQRKGDTLPVSAFTPNGEVPTGTSCHEKRNVAFSLPQWISQNCIQCNKCALVCPHACIRPYLLKKDSTLSKRLGAIPSKLFPQNDFAIQVSPADCTGCGNCAHVCPALKKALEMLPKDQIYQKQVNKYELVKNHTNPTITNPNVVTSQFNKPLFEFSGACAGCGETPYIKLLTQLVGSNLEIANATGCSSIYGGSYPTCPYTTLKNGKGPAWANSLFEDNAEFAYGMLLSHKNAQTQISNMATSECFGKKLNNLLSTWNSGDHSAQLQEQIISAALADKNQQQATMLLSLSSALTDKSFWAIGGDGWAYDIGFGGLDHVLSSNEKIRILVLDTEVYSNTGGQCSKSTPMGSVAKFASSGKTTFKKDMLSICSAYPNCYVASVSLGANPNQCLTAFKEALANNGPSIIFAFAPCQNHGINMSQTPSIQEQAVKSGYFQLLRHNPQTGNTIDPPQPNQSYQEFLSTQNRYRALQKADPQKAEELFKKAEDQNRLRAQKYKSNT